MSASVLVLDTELLVLFVVGTASRTYIGKHRRLRAYSESDFALLVDVISSVSKVLVTPNTLTETSNLVGYIAEPARGHIYKVLRAVIQATEEIYVESERAVARAEFVRLGLTDAVLLDMTAEPRSLLTADLDLYLAAISTGATAVNFNHLREASLSSGDG